MGTIAMANSGPNSGGSQFFINVGDNSYLDFDKEPLSSRHPVFGRIINGQEVVLAISGQATGPGDQPIEPIIINKVTINK
jgi:cyclophilin family peptidyl-prolyl cis-trans isomerase